jgi:hypothetical protein
MTVDIILADLSGQFTKMIRFGWGSLKTGFG